MMGGKKHKHNNNNNNNNNNNSSNINRQNKFLFFRCLLAPTSRLLFLILVLSSYITTARYPPPPPSSSWGFPSSWSSSWGTAAGGKNDINGDIIDDENNDEGHHNKTSSSSSSSSSISSRNNNNNNKQQKWSSMLTVDPSMIISLMVKHGGLLLPDDIQNDLDVIRKVCHTNKVELNVLKRKLVIYNFTVSFPNNNTTPKKDDDNDNNNNNNPAIRIGRMSISWDSYLRPCIDIEIEDVDILVEFYNILLTQHNWGQLQEAGFPPTFDDNEEESKQQQQEDFFRIGSIVLKGKITTRVTSRPLNNKDIAPPIDFNLHAFDPLNRRIENLAIENLALSGRKGCTPDEVYELIKIDFGKKIRDAIYDTIKKLSSSSSTDNTVVKEVHRVVTKTKDTISQYVDDAGSFWIGEQINPNKLLERFDEWGTRSRSRNNNKSDDKKSSNGSIHKSIWNIAKNVHDRISTSNEKTTKKNEEDDPGN